MGLTETGTYIIGHLLSSHRVPHTYHREASVSVRIRSVGDARGGSNAGSSRKEVRNDPNKDTAGNRGTVGGVTTNIPSMFKGERLQR